ncbi:MAG: VWA domain-containing protein [Acidobacteria bacterium]|nr:VWA domain-containing protein [Acidobacteriota bacterium]MCK6684771.1 VWA domain-containing protein [Thermoanaerobaculia bacterium]
MTWIKELPHIFVHPSYLAAGAAAVLLVLAGAMWSESRRQERRIQLVSESLAAKSGLVAPGPSRWVFAVLAILCGAGLFTALARPRWGATTENAKRQGTDIAIVLDTSASMNATDVTPSRFVLARQAALSLLGKLADDRVALIACEGEAQTLVPLTLDTAAAGLFLEALEPGVGTLPGTSVAAGLRTAASLFAGAPPGSRQCVFISDGEDLEGGVDDAIALAKSEGITVHTVYAGPTSARGAPVPNIDVAGRQTGYKTDESGKPILSKPDPELLRKVAAETGGSFSIVSAGKTDLDGVAGELDKAGRRPLAEALLTSQIERFQVPLAVAALALAFVLLGKPPLPSRRKKAAAAVLLTLLSAPTALAQAPPSTAAPEAPAPAAVPPSLWERLKAGMRLQTARGEAKKGITALESKKNEEAVQHFGLQKSLSPEDPRGAYNLGTALAKQDRTDEALANFAEARKDPKSAVAKDALYNQGNILLSKSKFDEAVRAYRESLKAAPGAADAAWNYELALKLAEMKRQQEQQQQQQQKNENDKQKEDQKKPTPTPSPEEEKKKQKEKEDREFEQKANMSRDKAEQLLSAIANADRDEQKKQLAERRKERRVSRDW